MADFAASDYKNRPDFKEKEWTHATSLKTKESTLDAKFRAQDELEAKTHIMNRKERDFKAAKAAWEAADASLKANQKRFAYESDQLVKGQDQDRLKFVLEDTAVKTSEIQGRHDDRTRINNALFKSLAS